MPTELHPPSSLKLVQTDLKAFKCCFGAFLGCCSFPNFLLCCAKKTVHSPSKQLQNSPHFDNFLGNRLTNQPQKLIVQSSDHKLSCGSRFFFIKLTNFVKLRLECVFGVSFLYIQRRDVPILKSIEGFQLCCHPIRHFG